jgi:hypothetical protein
MVLPDIRDLIAVDWDMAQREVESAAFIAARGNGAAMAAAENAARVAWNDTLRETGLARYVVAARSADRGGNGQQRCSVNGCHKFSIGPYCREHEHAADRPATAPAFRRAS